MSITLLTTEQVIDLQSSTLPNSGEPHMDKLEGALFRVQTLIDYENCEDVFLLAAMYLVGIAKAHAFHDANKRTAFQAASVFLMLNGFELNRSFELVKLTVMAAMNEADIESTRFALMILSDYRDELMDGYEEDDYLPQNAEENS